MAELRSRRDSTDPANPHDLTSDGKLGVEHSKPSSKESIGTDEHVIVWRSPAIGTPELKPFAQFFGQCVIRFRSWNEAYALIHRARSERVACRANWGSESLISNDGALNST